jgi:hypothetical protein
MEFQVKMTAGILYNYLMKQAYTSLVGWLGIFLGVMMTALYFIEGRFQGNYFALIAAFVVTFYTPWSLFLKSKKQMLINPAFKNPLQYIINNEGIQVSQNEQTVLTPWEQMYKATSTKKSIIVFTSRYNAWIFPRADLGDGADKLLELIKTHMAPARMKIKS